MSSCARSILALLLLAACHSERSAERLEHPDAAAALGQARCGVVKSADKPLVVEWPATERAALEARAGQGLVAVRYEGCEMEVLSQCTVTDDLGYRYLGLTTKRETVRIRTADELYARLPVGAASLEAQLERSGELDVDMTVVGRREASVYELSRHDLEGSCDRATHFVTGLTVGAFSMYTGKGLEGRAGVSVAGVGAGGGRGTTREILREDGDPSACAPATSRDEAPPSGCGALLRVEVVPLSEAPVARRGVHEPAPEIDPSPAQPSEPAPSEPAPIVHEKTRSVCDLIDFELVKVTRKPADPPFTHHAMDRVSLKITNRDDVAVELEGGSDASFLDAERNLITADVRDEWWMPQHMPPKSSVTVRILLPYKTAKTLRTIEVDATPEGAPFGRCRVIDGELSPTPQAAGS